jgi:hypothetical protein
MANKKQPAAQTDREEQRTAPDEPMAASQGQTAQDVGTDATEAEEAAEHALAKLFRAAGIKRIVCVDDVFAASLEQLLEQLAGFSPEERAQVLGGDPGDFAAEDVWQLRTRERWEASTQSEQSSLVDKAFAIGAGSEPVARGAIDALTRVLPQSLHLQGLSLKEWNEQREQLIEGVAQAPTLILVDQDFSHEGASADEGQRVITELEKALACAQAGDYVYYGLLTNTATPEEEQERRNEIVAAGGVDAMRLVVISKRNLDEEELVRFAGRLRVALLAPALAGLTNAVTEAVRGEQEQALKRASEMAPEEMEHMVFGTSERDGDWPPDTLLRVFSAMQRSGVRAKLRTAGPVLATTAHLEALRALSIDGKSADAALPAETDPRRETPAHPEAEGILREEIYDGAEHVNGLHLPIELGDLIEQPTKKRLWVVVAQPCVLVVRKKGEREPELTHATVARLTDAQANDGSRIDRFVLPHYEYKSKPMTVHLGRVGYPRAFILDTCVLNEDGVARLHVGTTSTTQLLPHWASRLKRIEKIGNSLLERVISLKSDKLTPELIVGHYREDPFPPVQVDDEQRLFEWDARRVGRVGEPYARALLSRFHQYQARDAFLSDLAE